MAVIKGTNVGSPVVPFDTADANPSHEALYGKGGYRTVATTAARDAIPAARREAGMLVYVVADETIYQLDSDLLTWSGLELGGGGGGSLPSGTEGYVLTYVSGSWVAAEPTGGVTSWNDLEDKPEFAPVATSGNYSDLDGVPADFAPASHAASHAEGGSDAIYISFTQVNNLAEFVADNLPTATTTTPGAVKIDGTSVTITDGVISVSTNYAAASHTHDDRYYTESEVDTLLGGKVGAGDASVTNAREWTADTVSQAEAEAGTSTTRRAFTPLRVFQAVAAWWAASAAKTKLDGIASGATANQTDAYLLSRANHTGTQAHTTITGLGTLATQSGTFSGTSSGTNTGDQTISLTGDVTGSGTGTFAATLASSGVSAGSYGSASSVATFTVDAKGRLTAAGSTAIAISAGAVSGLGGAATLNVGTSAGTVAAGNDSRFSDARTPTDGSVTDAKITSGGLSASSINWVGISAWAANTSYAKGDLVEFQGVAYRRSAAGTSGSTFNTANWQQITPTSFVVGQLPTVLEKPVTGGNTGTSVTLSLASGSVQTWTLNGNCTFTMPTATAGASLTVILTQGGTNTAAFTGVLWSGGTAPTITTTANKRDILVFVSDGTNWFGTAAQNF